MSRLGSGLARGLGLGLGGRGWGFGGLGSSAGSGSASRLAFGSSDRAITTEQASAMASHDSPSSRLLPPPEAVVVSRTAT